MRISVFIVRQAKEKQTQTRVHRLEVFKITGKIKISVGIFGVEHTVN